VAIFMRIATPSSDLGLAMTEEGITNFWRRMIVKSKNMSKYLSKITEYGFYLFIFLLPWQTRWIWHHGFLAGDHWEYGTFSLYGADILLVILFLLSLFLPHRQVRGTQRWWVLIGSFFLICFASIFWSQNKEVSWYAAARLGEGILADFLILRPKN
jgi:hypothetical protein